MDFARLRRMLALILLALIVYAAAEHFAGLAQEPMYQIHSDDLIWIYRFEHLPYAAAPGDEPERTHGIDQGGLERYVFHYLLSWSGKMPSGPLPTWDYDKDFNWNVAQGRVAPPEAVHFVRVANAGFMIVAAALIFIALAWAVHPLAGLVGALFFIGDPGSVEVIWSIGSDPLFWMLSTAVLALWVFLPMSLASAIVIGVAAGLATSAKINAAAVLVAYCLWLLLKRRYLFSGVALAAGIVVFVATNPVLFGSGVLGVPATLQRNARVAAAARGAHGPALSDVCPGGAMAGLLSPPRSHVADPAAYPLLAAAVAAGADRFLGGRFRHRPLRDGDFAGPALQIPHRGGSRHWPARGILAEGAAFPPCTMAQAHRGVRQAILISGSRRRWRISWMNYIGREDAKCRRGLGLRTIPISLPRGSAGEMRMVGTGYCGFTLLASLWIPARAFRAGIIGRAQAQGLGELGRGFLLAAGSGQSHAEMIVNIGAMRHDRQRGFEFPNGRGVFLALGKLPAEIDARVGVAGSISSAARYSATASSDRPRSPRVTARSLCPLAYRGFTASDSLCAEAASSSLPVMARARPRVLYVSGSARSILSDRRR